MEAKRQWINIFNVLRGKTRIVHSVKLSLKNIFRLAFKIETFSVNFNLSTTSTKGNYGEFISSRRKTMLDESQRQEEARRYNEQRKW